MQELIELVAQMSQADLAQKLGVCQSHISMIIGGKRKPSAALLNKVKRLYDGTEIITAKWAKAHGSASVIVSFSCPHMTATELTKLTHAIAYYASAYLLAEADYAAGLPGQHPKPLP